MMFQWKDYYMKSFQQKLNLLNKYNVHMVKKVVQLLKLFVELNELGQDKALETLPI